MFAKLRSTLQKTRKQFTNKLASLFFGKKHIDAALIDQLKNQLLLADVGVQATQRIVDALVQGLHDTPKKEHPNLWASLEAALVSILTPYAKPFEVHAAPFVLMAVGANGNGKTTTLGKLAYKLKKEGYSVVLAAGDTFRAAATAQLQGWGKKLEIPVITQPNGADSASVLFDAFSYAKAKGIDIVLADTAGRLHTKQPLMQELQKIKRVLSKLDPTAPHEIMLILDASTGQNAINQAKTFHEALGLHSITLTKLDGTAKGGILFAISEQLQLPLRFIGVGEGAEDLHPFDAKDFVTALLGDPLDHHDAATND